MLRIAKLTDYALLIVSQMARYPDAILSAAVLAELLGLSTATVSKILKILAEGDIVHSVRGADGGYHLAKSPAELTLVEVLTVMEGEVAMTTCCEQKEKCLLETNCLTRENWQKINHMVRQLLSQWTILDMLSPLKAEVQVDG